MTEKEEQLLVGRFCDLAERAQERGCFLFSDFLGLGEQSALHAAKTNFPRGARCPTATISAR